MSDILDNISIFVSRVIHWMQAFLGTLTATNVDGEGVSTGVMTNGAIVLLIFVIALPLCGLGVGILRRIIHTRG